ncbi:hypothetical protein BDK51DRAFT_45724 [Blyttiomyces helicus]|uniref:Uncharacterized protein n=1 Tax=Blyttiomyces helicus TaxID=388810 RepID=A0A4P9W563_9FUNG|nr:hypothetical protein BDK51DRAFT_45724 [Blyttiomyces helicus]|eukprot:RKO86425.1 hypothetical protein BDK51DRAFT_45724 [Blyttiomyces helicus]
MGLINKLKSFYEVHKVNKYAKRRTGTSVSYSYEWDSQHTRQQVGRFSLVAHENEYAYQQRFVEQQREEAMRRSTLARSNSAPDSHSTPHVAAPSHNHHHHSLPASVVPRNYDHPLVVLATEEDQYPYPSPGAMRADPEPMNFFEDDFVVGAAGGDHHHHHHRRWTVDPPPTHAQTLARAQTSRTRNGARRSAWQAGAEGGADAGRRAQEAGSKMLSRHRGLVMMVFTDEGGALLGAGERLTRMIGSVGLGAAIVSRLGGAKQLVPLQRHCSATHGQAQKPQP